MIQAEPVFLMSLFKPLLVALVVIGWSWIASRFDKDAAFFYLQRYWWNLGQICCAIVGVAMMLWTPIFVIGLFVGMAIMFGGLSVYAYYRNTQVPEPDQWTFSLDFFTQKIERIQHTQAQKHATIMLLAQDESRLDVPSGDEENTKAHAALEQILDFALPRGADQINLLVKPEKATMNVYIDGVKYPQGHLDPPIAMALIDYLKTVAGLDLEDRRKKQVGMVKFDAGELGLHTLDLETSGSTRELSLSCQVDVSRRAQLPITHLGLLETQKQSLQQLTQETGKVVLVATPPQLGMTTVLYSLMQEHDPYTSSVVTLEDDVLFELEGVSHHLIEEHAREEKINDRLAAILRSDPDVLLVSRFVNAKTATMVAKSANETRFYIGVRENDTFTALRHWVNDVGDPRLAARAIGAIIACRLIRKLCHTCRTPFQPDQTELKKLNLPADQTKNWFRSSGQVMVKDKAQPCPACVGLGYQGRTAVFEVMVLNQQARQFIGANDYDRLRSHLRKNKLLWLQEAALARVIDGTTDIKEIKRALGAQNPKRARTRSKSEQKKDRTKEGTS